MKKHLNIQSKLIKFTGIGTLPHYLNLLQRIDIYIQSYFTNMTSESLDVEFNRCSRFITPREPQKRDGSAIDYGTTINTWPYNFDIDRLQEYEADDLLSKHEAMLVNRLWNLRMFDDKYNNPDGAVNDRILECFAVRYKPTGNQDWTKYSDGQCYPFVKFIRYLQLYVKILERLEQKYFIDFPFDVWTKGHSIVNLYTAYKRGKNIILTGDAGVGKSMLADLYIKWKQHRLLNRKNSYKNSVSTCIDAINGMNRGIFQGGFNTLYNWGKAAKKVIHIKSSELLSADAVEHLAIYIDKYPQMTFILEARSKSVTMNQNLSRLDIATIHIGRYPRTYPVLLDVLHLIYSEFYREGVLSLEFKAYDEEGYPLSYWKVIQKLQEELLPVFNATFFYGNYKTLHSWLRRYLKSGQVHPISDYSDIEYSTPLKRPSTFDGFTSPEYNRMDFYRSRYPENSPHSKPVPPKVTKFIQRQIDLGNVIEPEYSQSRGKSKVYAIRITMLGEDGLPRLK